MSDLRQALYGILAALLSVFIVFGSIALALTEGTQSIGRVPAPTGTISMALLTPIDTPKPGEPTFTPSPTLPDAQLSNTQGLPACDHPTGWVNVSVEPFESLSSLAEKHGIGFEELRRGNCIPGKGEPPPGTFKSIYAPSLPTPTGTATPTSTRTPAPEARRNNPKPPSSVCSGPPAGWVVYIVKRGDNLYRIGLNTGTTAEVLRRANCLPSTKIITGQRLYVPRLPSPPTPTSTNRPATITPTRVTPAATIPLTPSNTPIITPPATWTPEPTNTPIPPNPTQSPPDTPTPIPTSTPEPNITP